MRQISVRYRDQLIRIANTAATNKKNDYPRKLPLQCQGRRAPCPRGSRDRLSRVSVSCSRVARCLREWSQSPEARSRSPCYPSLWRAYGWCRCRCPVKNIHMYLTPSLTTHIKKSYIKLSGGWNLSEKGRKSSAIPISECKQKTIHNPEGQKMWCWYTFKYVLTAKTIKPHDNAIKRKRACEKYR